MNKTISFLPQRRIHSNRAEPEKQKIRVAAYCRVSLDTEEQAGSYDIQVEHYTNYINRNPDWTLAGIFADDGISGTSTKKREAFNKMISKCMSGEIDMIITNAVITKGQLFTVKN